MTTWQTPRAAPRRRTRGQIWLATVPVLALSAWVVWFYLRATAGWSVPAATPLGRWYGGVGAGLMLILVLYSVRHAAYRRRWGSLQLWYRTHLWLGVLSLALVGAHCGFRCRGLFLTLLQLFFWGAVVSGLLGWLLQTWVKSVLLRHEERPLVMGQIARERDAAIEALTERVKTAIVRASLRSGAVGATHARGQEPSEAEATPGASHSPLPTTGLEEAALDEARQEVSRALRVVRAVRRRSIWQFPSVATWKKRVQYHGRPVLAHRLDDLEPAESAAALEEMARVNLLEVYASYHRWLRGWTTLHLALTLGLAQLALWHIYITTAY
jgi:hypothetical protein